jgi:hypothetical protein
LGNKLLLSDRSWLMLSLVVFPWPLYDCAYNYEFLFGQILSHRFSTLNLTVVISAYMVWKYTVVHCSLSTSMLITLLMQLIMYPICPCVRICADVSSTCWYLCFQTNRCLLSYIYSHFMLIISICGIRREHRLNLGHDLFYN